MHPVRVDVHAHFLPDEYRSALAALNPALPRVLPDCSTEKLLEMLGRFRIDAVVLALSPPGPYFGDLGQTRELARAMNEHAAALRESRPQQFATLGVLPLPDVEASVAEVGFALDRLGLDGFEMFTNVASAYPGDPAWEPVLAELDRRGAYVFVHPDTPPYDLPLPAYPVWLLEYPFESTRAIANLIYSGSLERYPRIRWHFAHLSGAAVFLAHRIASLAVRVPGLARQAPAGALEYLRRLYLDTAQADNPIALSAVLQLVPEDHLLFGTDWPYAALPATGSDPAPGLAYLPPAARSRAEGANAAALVPRLFAGR